MEGNFCTNILHSTTSSENVTACITTARLHIRYNIRVWCQLLDLCIGWNNDNSNYE